MNKNKDYETRQCICDVELNCVNVINLARNERITSCKIIPSLNDSPRNWTKPEFQLSGQGNPDPETNKIISTQCYPIAFTEMQTSLNGDW